MNSKSNALGPWDRESIEEAIDQWNDDIMDSAIHSEDDDLFESGESDASFGEEYGPTSCRDIIDDADYEFYYSDKDIEQANLNTNWYGSIIHDS